MIKDSKCAKINMKQLNSFSEGEKDMLTVIAAVLGVLFLIGGLLNIICNIKDIEEIGKGLLTIFGALVILSLCIGWKVRGNLLWFPLYNNI